MAASNERPVLVTGASGRTGRRLVEALLARGVRLRALVRRPQAGEELRALGVAEVALGDLTDPAAMSKAMVGAGQVLHICPPMHPAEDMRREAAAAGLPSERIETMVRMNAHYDAHGLVGNPNVLRWLLGREPTTYRAFVRRELLS